MFVFLWFQFDLELLALLLLYPTVLFLFSSDLKIWFEYDGLCKILSVSGRVQDKLTSSKTQTNKGENRAAKRKLYSPGCTSEDEGTKLLQWASS